MAKTPEEMTRNLETAASRKFWDGVKQAALRVSKWPKWKRGE